MCAKMSTQFRTFIFIIMFLPASHLPNSHVVVKVKDPTLLRCTIPCSGDVKWMLGTRPQILVSECKKGACVEGPGFKNRTRHVQGQPSLHLEPVMYNDKGWYICSCDDAEICKFHLDVVFPHLESVCIGANATIPCYAATDKHIPDNDIHVKWEKDGELVVKLHQGKMSYRPGLEGRGFVTASQYKDGDLSLSILKVQQSDGGIYRCIHRHEEPGQPEAVTLSIRETSECEAVKQSSFPSWGILLLVQAACVCVGGLLYKYKLIFIGQKSLLNDAGDDENPMMAAFCEKMTSNRSPQLLQRKEKTRKLSI